MQVNNVANVIIEILIQISRREDLPQTAISRFGDCLCA